MLWELLTLEIPYKGFEQSTIIYGVGNTKLTLPLPSSLPKGYRLLMKMCWKQKPHQRPSFQQILSHIENVANDFKNIPLDVYYIRHQQWKCEVQQMLLDTRIPFDNAIQSASSVSSPTDSVQPKTSSMSMTITPNRAQYETMLKKTANLYTDMVEVLTGLAEHEQKLLNANSADCQMQLAGNLLQQVINDPTFQTALQLRQSTSSTDTNSVSDRSHQTPSQNLIFEKKIFFQLDQKLPKQFHKECNVMKDNIINHLIKQTKDFH